jgi:hypothetical protein
MSSSEGHALHWGLLGDFAKQCGVRLSLPPTDENCTQRKLHRENILADLDDIGVDEAAALIQDEQDKEALWSDNHGFRGGTFTSDAEFRSAWKDVVERSLDASPLLAVHECNADFCSLTRGLTPLRRLALGTTVLDLAHVTMKEHFPAESDLAHKPFVYLSYASGGMGYDMQVLMHLYRRGVRNLKFVAVSHSMDFIPFLVEQAGAEVIAGVASLDTWSDPLLEADSRILTTEQPTMPPQSSPSSSSLPGGLTPLSLFTPGPRYSDAYYKARGRRQRWAYMHKTREQMYSVLHMMHQIGFTSPSIHLCNDARQLFAQDASLVGAVHALVAMDTFDDRADESTFADYVWLAQHALAQHGIASLCSRNGGWEGEIMAVQSRQTEQPPAGMVVQDAVVADPPMESLACLSPSTHELLFLVDDKKPSRATWAFIGYTARKGIYYHRWQLARAAFIAAGVAGVLAIGLKWIRGRKQSAAI